MAIVAWMTNNHMTHRLCAIHRGGGVVHSHPDGGISSREGRRHISRTIKSLGSRTSRAKGEGPACKGDHTAAEGIKTEGEVREKVDSGKGGSCNSEICV